MEYYILRKPVNINKIFQTCACISYQHENSQSDREPRTGDSWCGVPIPKLVFTPHFLIFMVEVHLRTITFVEASCMCSAIGCCLKKGICSVNHIVWQSNYVHIARLSPNWGRSGHPQL